MKNNRSGGGGGVSFRWKNDSGCLQTMTNVDFGWRRTVMGDELLTEKDSAMLQHGNVVKGFRQIRQL